MSKNSGKTIIERNVKPEKMASQNIQPVLPVDTFLLPHHARISLISMVMLFILGIAPYLVNLHGEFLLDDIEEIQLNPHIKQIWPLSQSMWKTRSLPVRPIPYLTFALNYACTGLDTIGYHITNIAIHGMCGVLIYLILNNLMNLPRVKDILGEFPLIVSWMIALIWLVHPLQTMPVNYIYQRIEIVYSCCMLLSILLFTVSVFHKKWNIVSSVSSVICCAIGMASKEVMIVTPFLILAIDYLLVVKEPHELISRKRFCYYGCLFSTIGIILYIFSCQYGSYTELRHSKSSWDFLCTQAVVIVHYIKLAFVPNPLIFDYYWPTSTVGISGCWWQFMLHCLMLLMLIYAMIKRKVWGLLILWFYGILAPTSSVLPINMNATEYRMYLPILGIIITFVYATMLMYSYIIANTKHRLNVVIGSLGAIVVIFSYMSYERSKVYRTFDEIWNSTMQADPTNWRPPFIIADNYLRKEQYQLAEKYYMDSIKLNPPTMAYLYNNLGAAIMKQGRLAESAKYFLEADRLSDPNFADPLFNMAFIAEEQNNIELAMKYYQAVLVKKPDHVETHINIGIILASRFNKFKEAYYHLKKAVEIEPFNEHAANNLAGFQRMMLEMNQPMDNQ